MLSKLIPMLMVISIPDVSGQNVLSNAGARNEALAGSTATSTNEWSLWRNPAGITSVKAPVLSFSTRQTKWVPASCQSTVLVVPIKSLTLGAGAARFGDDIYNEQMISLGAAHQIGITSIGVRADLFQLHIDGFDSKRTIGASLGFTTNVTQRLKVGACVRNVNLPSWATGQRLPVIVNAGVVYIPTTSFSFLAEIEKNTAHPPTIKGAVEYALKDRFFARTGHNLFPNAAFAGIGLRAWKLAFDYAMRFASAPGYAHVLSVAFHPHKPH
jgi:hypothetical protein